MIKVCRNENANSNLHFLWKILETDHILGIRSKRDRQKKLLYVSQEKYIEKVLERFQMTDAKPSSVPLQSQEKISKAHYPKDKEETEKMQGIPYASACASLMYAMVSTRSDVAYARVVSRFLSQPGQSHWAAVKSSLRYLKGTKGKRTCYGVMAKGTSHGYCDSDMAGDVNTRKSTQGNIYTLARELFHGVHSCNKLLHSRLHMPSISQLRAF